MSETGCIAVRESRVVAGATFRVCSADDISAVLSRVLARALARESLCSFCSWFHDFSVMISPRGPILMCGLVRSVCLLSVVIDLVRIFVTGTFALMGESVLNRLRVVILVIALAGSVIRLGGHTLSLSRARRRCGVACDCCALLVLCLVCRGFLSVLSRAGCCCCLFRFRVLVHLGPVDICLVSHL